MPPAILPILLAQLVPFAEPLPAGSVGSLQAPDVTVGDTMIWNVVNATHMDHPFHTHGFFFQPFELEVQDDVEPEDGFVEAIEPLENKDTFRIPRRPREEPFTSRTILRAYVRFDDEGREGQVRAEGQYPTETGSGGWLTHCHILEHARHGMLTFFETRYPDQRFWLLGTGLPGVSGVPVLRGEGAMAGGDPFASSVRDAAPRAPALLVVGGAQAATPFKGGTLVPSADFVLGGLVTGADGVLELAGRWPPDVPSGTSLWYQVWVDDAAAPAGLAASNALRSIAP